jgi:hypothetical protein
MIGVELWRVVCLGTMFVVLLAVLVIVIRVIAEIHRENKQDKRKSYDGPRETYDMSRLFMRLPAKGHLNARKLNKRVNDKPRLSR